MVDRGINSAGRRPGGWRLRPRKNSRGFTLTEVMVVVVIIAVIAAVAAPTFREHARKTRRKDALTTLLREAQMMERCFSRQHAYNNAACTGRYPVTTQDGHYSITLASTATTYTLTAAPPAGGVQASDTASGTNCGAGITINQLGVRAPANCW